MELAGVVFVFQFNDVLYYALRYKYTIVSQKENIMMLENSNTI